MKHYTSLIILLIISIISFTQSVPKGLEVNDKAPEFKAIDQSGNLISLKEELKKGSLVIVFYRGQWCPYCNKQLAALQDSIDFIKAKAANIIAISPEISENINKTIEKTKASYPVLFDDSLNIMQQYDVAFKLDSNTIERYKNYGLDLDKLNGSNGASLPVPAVYIINQKGIIVYKYFDSNYKTRVSVKEILSHL